MYSEYMFLLKKNCRGVRNLVQLEDPKERFGISLGPKLLLAPHKCDAKLSPFS